LQWQQKNTPAFKSHWTKKSAATTMCCWEI
jgi:hypothetical protein